MDDKGKSGTTFINFAYCELEGKWRKISKGDHDVEIYESMENAKVSVRIFDERKTKYQLKKGARITIKDHMLIFHKEDFAEQLKYSKILKKD